VTANESHPYRNKILPFNLKKEYGQLENIHDDLTHNDVQLFLSLFYCVNQKDGRIYYELDKFSEKLHPVAPANKDFGDCTEIKLKISREIDDAILRLIKRKVVEESQDELHPTAQARTIAMLLALRDFLGLPRESESPDRIFELSRHDNISFGNGQNTWRLSYPLLLVQAIRFSQWEYQNQDYCFEYYTAKRSRNYFDNKFSKWFFATKNQTNQEILLKKSLSEGIDTLTRLIRWHTLEGQNWRSTSHFGLETVCQLLEKSSKKYERPLLYAITYTDAYIRKHGCDFEKKVRAKIANQRHSRNPTDTNLLNQLKKLSCDIDENKENGESRLYPSKELCREIEKCFPYTELVIPEDIQMDKQKKRAGGDEMLIWSYSMPRGNLKCNLSEAERERHEELIQRLKNEIKRYNEAHAKANTHKVDISHNCVLRNQRNVGVLSKILNDSSKSGKIQTLPNSPFVDVRKSQTLQIGEVKDQINKELVTLVAFRPRFVASRVYGLKLDQTRRKVAESPLFFLKASFEKLLEKYNGTIPLPMVKRITDLLEFYAFELDGKKELANKKKFSKDPTVFALTLSFDNGKESFQIWLPENPSGSKNKTLKKPHEHLEVTDILVRYIHCFICNYGMTKQFRQVDLDFSSSKNFKAGETLQWHKLLDENKDTKNSKKGLGLHVFERYLTDVGISKQETFFTKEVYQKAIQKRKIIVPHKFDTEIDKLKLDKRYVLGIDIGGTGVKIKLFKISIERKNAAKSYKLIEHSAEGESQHLYLVPEEMNGKDIEFSVPTAPSRKDSNAEEKNKYKNAEEFATYIVDMLWRKINLLYGNDETLTNNLFNKIISIGFCWPGPIKQNRIASTSGILRHFKGFSPRILENEYSEIIKLDIAEAVRQAFKKKQKNNDHNEVMVALANDGDVEAAGLAFGLACGKNNRNKFYKNLFDNHSVAVIKAGTGTAGSVLDNGEIKGLNEFGKIIVDVGVNNTNNLNKPEDQRWPGGDANKFFSMKPFRRILLELGVPQDNADEITGRDIDLLLNLKGDCNNLFDNRSISNASLRSNNLNKVQFTKDERQHFGALEFIDLTAPYLEWTDLFDKKDIPKKDITVTIDDNKAYQIEFGNEIDAHTWWNLSNEPMAKPLNLPADKPMRFFMHEEQTPASECQRTGGLIERLGKNRIARMNYERLVHKLKRSSIRKGKKKDTDRGKINFSLLEDKIRDIGRRLAHIIALLHDIYGIKAVFVSGGVMNSKKISGICMEGLKPELKDYYPGESHLKNIVWILNNEDIENDEQSDSTGQERIENSHLIIKPEGSNHALLGAAVLGFDYFIEEKKIAELQELANEREYVVDKKITFLTKKEALRFLKDNAGRLRITVDDNGTVGSLN